jgi:hypothetical protein
VSEEPTATEVVEQDTVRVVAMAVPGGTKISKHSSVVVVDDEAVKAVVPGA